MLFCNSFPYNYRRNHEWELWEREIEVRVFPSCYFEFSQASTSVLISITYGNTENCFYFFYKITRRKLKRGNSLLYQSVNSQYCSWWRMRWRIMAWTVPSFPYSYRNTAFSQSKLSFSKCYFINNKSMPHTFNISKEFSGVDLNPIFATTLIPFSISLLCKSRFTCHKPQEQFRKW